MDQNTLNIVLWLAVAVVAVLYFRRRRSRKMKEWKQK